MNPILNTAKNTKIIYKGDVMAGSFYLFLGVLSILVSGFYYFFTERLGFYYLSIGLVVLAIYMLGKGSVMIYLYYSRYQYFRNHETLTPSEVKEERRYIRWRRAKKKRNRRKYIYAMVFGAFIAFAGFFHQEKGLIVSTCIPIVTMSFVEFVVGIMTEFRLTEYLKYLYALELEH